jgi:hypothetical protein
MAFTNGLFPDTEAFVGFGRENLAAITKLAFALLTAEIRFDKLLVFVLL